MRSSEKCHFNQILIYSRLGADITDLFYLDVDRIAKDNEQFGAEVNYSNWLLSVACASDWHPTEETPLDR